jgi:hypothetical protein
MIGQEPHRFLYLIGEYSEWAPADFTCQKRRFEGVSTRLLLTRGAAKGWRRLGVDGSLKERLTRLCEGAWAREERPLFWVGTGQGFPFAA